MAGVSMCLYGAFYYHFEGLRECSGLWFPMWRVLMIQAQPAYLIPVFGIDFSLLAFGI